MAEVLKKFGKYFLLDLIAQGGMAEIYRARMATPDGGARLVAIKKVLRSYTQNHEFVNMFKGEIKTTSAFTHPNIVQIYDFGEEDTQLYLAMELVDGKNLRQFISRSAELKAGFPVEVCIYLIEQATAAMAYAHGFKDKFTGAGLNIVHRDISPQNILISYDGAVKVIDFGIAKAVTNVENTRAGVIKGKPSYLSPEQISGDVLDGRSDLFALGIVLWEVLTGRKLFASDNDYGVLKLIENCNAHVKPPSLHNPKVPKELDAIVLKCLQKDRNQRYLNAAEMQRALHKTLYQVYPEFNPADLSYYAKDLFKHEIVDDRQRLLRINEKAEKLLVALNQNPSTAPKEKTMVGTNTALTGSQADQQKPASLNKGINTGTVGLSEALKQQEKSEANFKKKENKVVELKEKTKVGLDFEGSKVNITRTNLNNPYAPTGAESSQSKTYSMEIKKKSSPSFAMLMLFVAIAGGAYYVLKPGQDRSPSSEAEKTGKLTIQANVNVATVSIDNQVVGNSLPLTLNKVAAGQTLKMTVFSNGFKREFRDVIVVPGESKVIQVNLQREEGSAVDPSVLANTAGENGQNTDARTIPVRFVIEPKMPGTITRVKLNGTSIDSLTFSGSAPMDSPLEVVVERDGFRTFQKTFSIESEKFSASSEYVMDIKLEQAKFGFLSIKTTPSADAILVIEGVEERISTPISRKRVPVGTYEIKLVNPILGMEKSVTVNIEEDRFSNIEERLQLQGAPSGTLRAPGSN